MVRCAQVSHLRKLSYTILLSCATTFLVFLTASGKPTDGSAPHVQSYPAVRSQTNESQRLTVHGTRGARKKRTAPRRYADRAAAIRGMKGTLPGAGPAVLVPLKVVHPCEGAGAARRPFAISARTLRALSRASAGETAFEEPSLTRLRLRPGRL